MTYILGIDGGGSKTVCILMNHQHQIIGRGKAGPSNYQSMGRQAALISIKSAIESAVNNAKQLTNPLKITAICLGLAGVGRAADIEIVKEIVQELKNIQKSPITWDLSPSNITICNDALIALIGGIGHDVGIVVAAGTGSIVFGRNHQGKTKRVGGWGYLLGDEGSAYKIAVHGMQATLKSYDGCEISTRLIEDFKQHLDLANLEDLIEVIYRQGWDVKKIAALAPIVDIAAASGDELANQIIDNAVKELVIATSTVMKTIFNLDSTLEIVTTGSIWQTQCKMHQRFTNSLHKDFPLVNVIMPRNEPAYGAALLAWQTLQIA
ncbi:N-acetylglucosamine kinase [Nostocales cyanobacterium LEGE 11386]|nr:N-acetylglucosamine kinase [Nostocales cyanobacterium LEGE 11386]